MTRTCPHCGQKVDKPAIDKRIDELADLINEYRNADGNFEDLSTTAKTFMKALVEERRNLTKTRWAGILLTEGTPIPKNWKTPKELKRMQPQRRGQPVALKVEELK